MNDFNPIVVVVGFMKQALTFIWMNGINTALSIEYVCTNVLTVSVEMLPFLQPFDLSSPVHYQLNGMFSTRTC